MQSSHGTGNHPRTSSFSNLHSFVTHTFPLRIQAAPARLFQVNSPGFFKKKVFKKKQHKPVKDPAAGLPILSDEETGEPVSLLEREYRHFSDPQELELHPALLCVNERVGRVIFSLNEMALNVKYVTDLGTPIQRVSPTEVVLADKKIPVPQVANDWGLQRSDSEGSVVAHDVSHHSASHHVAALGPNGQASTAVTAEQAAQRIKDEEERGKRAAIEMKMLQDEKAKRQREEKARLEKEEQERIARKGETEAQRKQRIAKEKKEKEEQQTKEKAAQQKLKELMDKQEKEEREQREREEIERREKEEAGKALERERKHQEDLARHHRLQREAEEQVREEMERAKRMEAEWKMFQIEGRKERSKSNLEGIAKEVAREQHAKLEREKAARLEQERIAREAKERRDREDQERKAKEREEQERIEGEKKERIAREEQERIAKEQQRIAKEQQDRAARDEQERVDREEQERPEREEKERVAKEEQERLQREEQERVAKEEQERLQREEQDRLAKDPERIAREREEAERLASEEREREEREKIAREEQERISREEEERREQARIALEEQDRRIKEEQERVAREEAERMEQERIAKEEEEKRAKEERIEEARLAKEEEQKSAKEEAERIERERLAKEEEERRAREETVRREQERIAREEEARVEQERITKEAERIAREAQLERESEEQERAAKEEQEKLARKEQEREREEQERVARQEKERLESEEQANNEKERSRSASLSRLNSWLEQSSEERDRMLMEEMKRERELRAQTVPHSPHTNFGYLPSSHHSHNILVYTPKASLVHPKLTPVPASSSPSTHKHVSKANPENLSPSSFPSVHASPSSYLVPSNLSLDFSLLEDAGSKSTKPRSLNFDNHTPSPSFPSPISPLLEDIPPPLPPKPANIKMSSRSKSRTKEDVTSRPNSSSVPQPSGPISNASFDLPPISMKPARGSSVSNTLLPSLSNNADPFNLFTQPSNIQIPTSNYDFNDPFSLNASPPKPSTPKKASTSDLLLGFDPFA